MNHTIEPSLFSDKAHLVGLIAELLGPVNGRNLLIADKLLHHFGDLKGIAHADNNALLKVAGMTPLRARRIMTAFKLGRCSFVPSDSPKAVTCPEDAFHHFSPYLKGLIYEELHALYLNHSKKVLLHRRLSSGSNHMTVVDPKQVLYHAIVMRASGIILAHNHPSGNPPPSKQDIEVTRRMGQSAEVMGIHLLDHLVIGGGDYLSMAEEGLGFGSSASSRGLDCR